MFGTIYFAYADPFEVFDDSVHNVQDEEVFNLKISQSEGEFAQAEVTIINPIEGLLNPLRKKRVFISVQDGVSVNLLFSGRIVGFPIDFGQETIGLRIIAQPEDWEATQAAFVQTLKVAPYYNELFIPEEKRNDPAEILSGYSSIFHWDRKTGNLALSDILEGSQFIDVAEDYIFDSLSSEIGDPPLKGVNISVEVQWQQLGVGEADCSEVIRNKFTNSAIGTPQINTLTPLAFEKGWEGVRIPTGYSIKETKLVPVANGFGLTQANLRSGQATVDGVDYPTATGATPPSRLVSVPRVWYTGKLVLQANYEQKRREIFATVLELATQNISLKSEEYEDMSFRLQDPTSVVNGEVLDVAKPSFFMDGIAISTYGEEAIEHALMRARARLLKSSRIIETSFEVPIETVMDISCDYSVRIQDDRLPGGSLRGKVIGYSMTVEGSTGSQIGEITIASAIGTGADSSGLGTTVGTTVYENEFGSPTMTSEIFYDQDTPPVIDEPIDVALMESDNEYLVIDAAVDNDGESQNNQFVLETLPDTYLNNNRTRIEVELRSMNPEPELFADVPITSYTLTAPRQIDLEA